jgi:lipid-binding SYLF domain-containing protein
MLRTVRGLYCISMTTMDVIFASLVKLFLKEIAMNAAKILLASLLIPAGAGLVSLTGCGSEPNTPVEAKQLTNDSTASLKDMELQDSSLQAKVDGSYAYAVFPSVGKGGVGIEGASGTGDVFEQGKYIGTSRLTMVGTGIDIGAQTYSELILFQDKAALDKFENNNLRFDASTSAVAIKAGAASSNDFAKGVLVLLNVHGGAMLEAGIGGQQFTFKAANAAPATQPM